MDESTKNSSAPEAVKKQMRADLLSKRLQLRPELVEAMSQSICERIALFIEKYDFESVFSYFAFRNEPDLSQLLVFLDEMSVSYPVISQADGDMEFYQWRKPDKLSINKWGISEPVVSAESVPSIPDRKTLILVPSLSLDRYGFRLGYGGGYYDRFLHAYPETQCLGVCFSDFFQEDLPVEAWDRRLNYLCSEKELLKIEE